MMFEHTTKSLIDENYILIIPKNETTVFVFWKFSEYKNFQFQNKNYKENIIIKIFENSNLVVEISAKWNDARKYIVLPKKSKEIFAELYAENQNENERIAVSNTLRFFYKEEENISFSKF